mgnify:CR=1 FL=1
MALKCSVKEQTSEMTTTKIFELIAVGIFKKLNFQFDITLHAYLHRFKMLIV